MTHETQGGGNNLLKATDSIEYVMEISNTGNTCLREIALDDSAFACDILTSGKSTFVFGTSMFHTNATGVFLFALPSRTNPATYSFFQLSKTMVQTFEGESFRPLLEPGRRTAKISNSIPTQFVPKT